MKIILFILLLSISNCNKVSHLLLKFKYSILLLFKLIFSIEFKFEINLQISFDFKLLFERFKFFNKFNFDKFFNSSSFKKLFDKFNSHKLIKLLNPFKEINLLKETSKNFNCKFLFSNELKLIFVILLLLIDNFSQEKGILLISLILLLFKTYSNKLFSAIKGKSFKLCLEKS